MPDWCWTAALVPERRRLQSLPLAAHLAHTCARTRPCAGPVRPFVSIDVPPAERAALPAWRQALHASCLQWRADASAALAQGGPLSARLPQLAEAAEQYLWGGASGAARGLRCWQEVQGAPAMAALLDSPPCAHATLLICCALSPRMRRCLGRRV